MISGSMALSTDSMVGTRCDMLLGMTGTGMLMLVGRCIFIFIIFLFFLAAVWSTKQRVGVKASIRETIDLIHTLSISHICIVFV